MWYTILKIGWPFFIVVILYRPVTIAFFWMIAKVTMLFSRPHTEELPCPKCGYDCRVFDHRKKSHRCPECGTELRWGQYAHPPTEDDFD